MKLISLSDANVSRREDHVDANAGRTSHAEYSSRTRWGFTLVEVLVSIAILALLMSVVVPAVVRSRATARRISCSSNLSQLVLSAGELAENSPQAGKPPIINPTVVASLPTDVAWPYAVEQFRRPSTVPPLETGTTGPAFPLDASWRCPSDLEPARVGHFSYVINDAFNDWSRDSGAMNDNKGSVLRADWPDGASQTAFFSERIVTAEELVATMIDPYAEPTGVVGSRRYMYYTKLPLTTITTPGGVDTFRAACREPIAEPRPLAFPWRREHAKAVGGLGALYHHGMTPNAPSCWLGPSDHARTPLRDSVVFYAFNTASSEHEGIVNVGFADRSVRFISEQVASEIWTALGSSESNDVVGEF